MSRNQGGVGPPNEVEGQTPHHRGQPSTSSFGSHHATPTVAQSTGSRPMEWHCDLGLPDDDDRTEDLRSGLRRGVS